MKSSLCPLSPFSGSDRSNFLCIPNGNNIFKKQINNMWINNAEKVKSFPFFLI